jgi:stage V sporulation protein R
LDTYPNQLEIITAEQMMDAYASVGMPVNYRHWSYGKEFIATEKNYKRGHMGLAYEIVINSNPCISYLMEENTMAMQALVIAHAAYGHNSFFKGNYLFRMWTDAASIIDYLVYAKNYVAECEERHGLDAVESFLDSCHALQNHGVDRYRRPSRKSLAQELAERKDREAYAQTQVNDMWRTLPKRAEKAEELSGTRRFPEEPQENLLYFIEKNAPLLEPWQREIVRIVRKVAQYFYPQRQTQVMNEGWATFWHHRLLNQMYDDGYLTDGVMIEWLKSHTNVVYQPPVGHRAYSGINPYALGFAMYTDLKRICEEPTDEDRQWFPEIAGTPWLPALDQAMRNYKDESFVGQFLSPKLMRELRLFAIVDDEKQSELEVAAIHDDSGYKRVRESLAHQYDLGSREPNIQVWNVNLRGDRSLTLRHFQHNNRPLHDTAGEVLKHVARLWGFGVQLESVNAAGDVSKRWSLPGPSA